MTCKIIDNSVNIIKFPKRYYAKEGIIIQYNISEKESDLVCNSQKALDNLCAGTYDEQFEQQDYITEIIYIGMSFYKSKVHISHG